MGGYGRAEATDQMQQAEQSVGFGHRRLCRHPPDVFCQEEDGIWHGKRQAEREIYADTLLLSTDPRLADNCIAASVVHQEDGCVVKVKAIVD